MKLLSTVRVREIRPEMVQVLEALAIFEGNNYEVMRDTR